MKNLIKINMLLATTALLASGCSMSAGGDSSGRITNYSKCLLPKDQGRGSFQGAWASLPVPVVFDRDFYASDQGVVLPAFRSAIQTWNNWAAVRGQVAFKIVNDGADNSLAAGRDIPQVTDCYQAAYSSSVTDAVGIWKISTYGYHANVRPNGCGRILAFDPTEGTGVQGQTDWVMLNGKIAGASILLNYEGFNAPGRTRIDSESLLLHELGHVLGLLHSCNGSGGGSFDLSTAPACASAPVAYLNSVMFPFLQPAQERRSLSQNEFNRINCIY